MSTGTAPSWLAACVPARLPVPPWVTQSWRFLARSRRKRGRRIAIGRSARLTSLSASPTPPVLYAFSDADKVSHALADFVIAAQNDAISKRGTFKLAISGGSLAATLAKHLVGEERVKWDKW